MIKRILAILAVAVVAAVGCGSSHHHIAASHPSASRAVHVLTHGKTAAQAKTIFKGCERKDGFTSRADLTKLAQCTVPRGHGAAFLSCAFKAGLAMLHLHSTAATKQKFALAVEACAVANR